MNTRAKIFAAAFALAAAAGVNAQSSIDKSFTVTGTTCADVNWSPEMLAKHPNIGSACQEVMQRNGISYVKFEGEVKKVAKNGMTGWDENDEDHDPWEPSTGGFNPKVYRLPKDVLKRRQKIAKERYGNARHSFNQGLGLYDKFGRKQFIPGLTVV